MFKVKLLISVLEFISTPPIIKKIRFSWKTINLVQATDSLIESTVVPLLKILCKKKCVDGVVY